MYMYGKQWILQKVTNDRIKEADYVIVNKNTKLTKKYTK